jgi:tRNA threonylcarbamoyladenosine biosynthesis protein TsaE
VTGRGRGWERRPSKRFLTPVNRNQSKILSTDSEAATEALGVSMGLRIRQGLCACLVGSLGTGKSVLVRGICRGLGVKEEVLSPTFVLFEEYRGRLPVVHLDLYRLKHESEIEELGAFDRMGNGSVILVEWGDRSSRILDMSDVVIRLQMTGGTSRRIVADYTEGLSDVFGGLPT